MKTKTVTAAVVASATLGGVDASGCIPDPDDQRYGALCVEKKNPTEKCDDVSEKSNLKKKGKEGEKKKVALYYGGSDGSKKDDKDACVPAEELEVTKCDDHLVVTVDADAGCAVVEADTTGCNTKEMCAQRHETGNLCPNCTGAGKLHACAGCPNNTEVRRALLKW